MDMDQSFNMSNTMEDVDQSEQYYFESPVPPRTTTEIPSCNRRHPVYKGIRCRSGKWVTEIREPRTTTRIWLGTYPTPEMAAAAHDAAALVLKGPDTSLNFPNHTYTTFLLLPTVDVAVQIRAVAANAAASRAAVSESTVALAAPPTSNNNMNTFTTEKQYEDEEELLDMPNLLMDMANGMLVSPPRSMITTSSPSDDYVEENLWSFRF